MSAGDEMARHRSGSPREGRRRRLLRSCILLAAALIAAGLAWWGFLRTAEPESWPPASTAVSAEHALEATAEFVGNDGASVSDLGAKFAWSTAASVDPLPGGSRYFSRMLADIADARSSVHLMQFGFTRGKIGDAFADELKRALGRGVEVRLVVDAYGSDPGGKSRALYEGLQSAGAQIVVNDALPIGRLGLYPDRVLDRSLHQVGHYDHRKLLVVDGRVAYTGGAGIADHFADDRFRDIMVRVTGDVVRQMQMVFLTTFHAHGGPLKTGTADLAKYFTASVDSGEARAVVVGVRHARDVSALQAARQMIDDAQRRIDVASPYFTEDELVDRLVAAARRGVKVRVLVSRESNSRIHDAALRHDYGRMLAAGVEIWEYPDAVMHAKVLVADDQVMFGTVNLDAWALYRAYEVAVIVDHAETTERFEREFFGPEIARSRPGRPPSDGWSRLGDFLADKLSYFL